MSGEERRISFLKSYLENRALGGDEAARTYRDRGAPWPVRELPDEIREHAERAIEEHDCQQNQCVRNAQTLALAYPDRYRYVEGYFYSDAIDNAGPHAWVIDDGYLVEVTMPPMRPRPMRHTSFFGAAYDTETVAEHVGLSEREHDRSLPIAWEGSKKSEWVRKARLSPL